MPPSSDEWRTGYFGVDGQPIDMETWMSLFDIDEYARVGLDEGDGWRVSTVWLGLYFGPCSPPLIFETLVEGLDDFDVVRYPTHAEAMQGHAALVEHMRTKTG